MIQDQLKTAYWNMLRRWNHMVHPQSKSYSPHPWMDAVKQHVPEDADPLIMVDGGAHNGMMARQFHRHFSNLQVHAFEPNTDLLPDLKNNLADIPGTCNPLALGSQTHTSEIIINASPMTSSLLPRNELGCKYFDYDTRPLENRNIQVTTLDDWFAGSGLDRIHLIKLDLQGYEVEALKGASRVLNQGVSCIFIEVHFIPFYQDCSLFADIDSLLRQQGYCLYNLYNLCTHLPEGQIGSADAIYIPDKNAICQKLKEAA